MASSSFFWMTILLILIHKPLKSLPMQKFTFCLPLYTTHVAQPLGVTFFGPPKKHWSKVCHSYMTSNPGKVVTKFCSLLNQAWFKAINSAIISGFHKAGVCPFNATAIQPYFNGLSDEIFCSSSNEAMRLSVTSPLLRKTQNL